MIKVKKKVVDEPKVYEAQCCECGCDLECTEEDMHEGPLGAMYITCPECDNEVMIDELDGVNLNSSNIQFPKHFFKYGDGAPVEDERIQDAVKEMLAQMEKSCHDEYMYWATGDSMVIVMDSSEEIKVVVAKGYYECDIFEKCYG